MSANADRRLAERGRRRARVSARRGARSCWLNDGHARSRTNHVRKTMRLGRASAYGMIAMMDIAKAAPRSSSSTKNGKSPPPPGSARPANGHAHRNGGNGHGSSATASATAAAAPQSRARQIAEDTGIPVEYLRKVLQRL